jgi:hypothetical protein
VQHGKFKKDLPAFATGLFVFQNLKSEIFLFAARWQHFFYLA